MHFKVFHSLNVIFPVCSTPYELNVANGVNLCLLLYSVPSDTHDFDDGQSACQANSNGQLYEFANFDAEQATITAFLYAKGGKNSSFMSLEIFKCLPSWNLRSRLGFFSVYPINFRWGSMWYVSFYLSILSYSILNNVAELTILLHFLSFKTKQV